MIADVMWLTEDGQPLLMSNYPVEDLSAGSLPTPPRWYLLWTGHLSGDITITCEWQVTHREWMRGTTPRLRRSAWWRSWFERDPDARGHLRRGEVPIIAERWMRGGWMEFSLDDGVTWQRIATTTVLPQQRVRVGIRFNVPLGAPNYVGPIRAVVYYDIAYDFAAS